MTIATEPVPAWKHVAGIISEAQTNANITDTEFGMNISADTLYLSFMGLTPLNLNVILMNQLEFTMFFDDINVKAVVRPAIVQTEGDPRFDLSFHYTYERGTE